MHAIHLINGEHYSGAERVQDILALLLPEMGCDVSFGCLKPGIFPEKCSCSPDLIHDFPMASKFSFSPVLKIKSFIRNRSVDIIHTHTPRAAMIGRVVSFLSGKPMVHHVHSPSLVETENKLRNRQLYYLERFCMMGVKHLMPVSNSLKDYLMRLHVSGDRITVIHNGVPSPGPLAERTTPGDRLVLGMVALFRPRKGLEVLLKAVARLVEKHSVRIRLIGPFEDPEYKRKIEAMALDLLPEDTIEYVGFVSDVNAELRKVDVMVLPSLFGEGLPMVVLEAMAIGVPVISTKVEGVPEAIEDGLSGVLVEPGDPESLSQAITEFITGHWDYQSIRSAAYERHGARFSAEVMAGKVLDVYQKVLGG